MSSITAPHEAVSAGLFEPRQLIRSLPDAARKLDPRDMVHNPVMFVVLVGAILTTVMSFVEPSVFAWLVTGWLWLTVLFANLAEAVCAIKWPKWPEYRGPIDLGLLRWALDGTVIDGPTLNWLGGKEIVRECAVRAAAG